MALPQTVSPRRVPALVAGMAALVGAALIVPTDATAQSVFTGFKGQLIVASPRMPDPRFSNTVVFIVAHEAGGAVGVIINRPTADVPLADIRSLVQRNDTDSDDDRDSGATEGSKDTEDTEDAEDGDDPALADDDDTAVTIFVGGPVAPNAGQVLHIADFATDDTLIVDDAFAVTGWGPFLEQAAHESLPERAIFTLGLSTWGPGQLEREVIQGAWTSRPADPALVFDGDPETLWDRVSEDPGSRL